MQSYYIVPTISDRAWQCLAKYALEPAHEATFHQDSYGFRAGRSAHDAQAWLFLQLKNGTRANKRILEIDIHKCFDKIAHKSIMDRLIAPNSLKTGIFRCLKAGVNLEFPEQGTPQGGVCSPLLANIALNGIEDVQPSQGRRIKIYCGKRRGGKDYYRYERAVKAVRYADDMIFILNDLGDEELNRRQESSLITEIQRFLEERGMGLSQEKTKLTKSTQGFDFLGWNHKKQANGKFKSTPSKENYTSFKKKVKAIVQSSNYGAAEKAQKLAPLVRGWRNYHKYCRMASSRDSLWFINSRTFKVFNKERKQNRKSCERLIKEAFPKVSVRENQHNKVKGDKSPYDGDYAYWTMRESKLYDGGTAKALKKQNHTCAHCGLKIYPGEKVELHHKDGNHKNWAATNLAALHRSCHQMEHVSKSKELRMSRSRDAAKVARPVLKERCSR